MIDTIKKQSLKSLLNIFDITLDSIVNQVWSENPDHLESFSSGMAKITHHILELGEYVKNELDESSIESNELLPSYIIQYSWMEEAKSFLILWRDVIFQYQKALVLKSNQKISEESLMQLRLTSKDVIQEGVNYLKNYLEKETTNLEKNKRELKSKIFEWKKNKSPYGIYRVQIETINQQCEKLIEQYQSLLKSSKVFQNIGQLIQQNITTSKVEIDQLKILANDAKKLVEDHVTDKPGKLSTLLINMESKLETSQHLELLNISINKEIESLEDNIQVPIEVDGGLLLFREINLKNISRLWLESETTPLVYEFWKVNDQILNSFKMALMNIRNRAMLFSSELKKEDGTKGGIDPRFEQDKFWYPIVSFLQKTNLWENELNSLSGIIQDRLSKEFQISEIYNTEKVFLPIPLQTTINQYRLTQNPWVLNTQNWLKKQIRRFQKFKNTVEKEDALSISEKIVRFVQNKNRPIGNHQYSNIFLTKGYMGKSFWVGRKIELERFNNIVDQWKIGFRGAVILSGQRFSGKSLFGEYISTLHFPQKSIRLLPNVTLKVGGRILETTYDLGAAIDFIQKYSVNDQSLIWIDDLENWSDPNIPLGQNVRALIKSIDNHGGRMFFMVSMANWMVAHLDKTHEIQKVFQADINLDKMSSAEIKEAILIRHGATHKILVNKNNEEPSPQEFQKMTDGIFRYTLGNIGESLSRWSFSIYKKSEEKVEFRASINYAFPDFLNPDVAIILTTLMMEKRTNEYRLRKLFGSPFQEKFNFIIQRLISIGILTRHIDGWLEVNEVVVNEVGKILEEKNYLKFY
ncbi:MAG: hypothetical protein P8Q41_08925 [Saprospiraceae bacterium]|nr:hypothetical protein [Saprospiraceae bacterium]